MKLFILIVVLSLVCSIYCVSTVRFTRYTYSDNQCTNNVGIYSLTAVDGQYCSSETTCTQLGVTSMYYKTECNFPLPAFPATWNIVEWHSSDSTCSTVGSIYAAPPNTCWVGEAQETMESVRSFLFSPCADGSFYWYIHAGVDDCTDTQAFEHLISPTCFVGPINYMKGVCALSSPPGGWTPFSPPIGSPTNAPIDINSPGNLPSGPLPIGSPTSAPVGSPVISPGSAPTAETPNMESPVSAAPTSSQSPSVTPVKGQFSSASQFAVYGGALGLGFGALSLLVVG